MGVGRRIRGFGAHRTLIGVGVGGAVAETAVLAGIAPGARALGPQVTALPPLAAYHDLRWLFAFGQPWLEFLLVLFVLLAARAAVDALLVLLSWPTDTDRPRYWNVFWSCALLTLLMWLVLSPVVTVMFGLALVPFSWPFLAVVPILLASAVLLSHGGVLPAWWGRLPAVSAMTWLIGGFVIMSAVAALSPHLNVAEFLLVAAVAGLLNARAWYGVTRAVASAKVPKFTWLPVAPVAVVLVIGMVIGVARLTFTGTIHIAPQPVTALPVSAQTQAVHAALLVVAGFGSNCCEDANALAATDAGSMVRQFSYLGLSRSGQPIPYHRADDLPIQEIGDRMAAQVLWLHAHTQAPVSIVAESEGTLGLYAMLARHHGLPLSSIVLLSPIIEPGQADQAGVPREALITLNNLIGTMSPYGRNGAQELIDSVGEVGASYFSDLANLHGIRWLAVIPLADAVTLAPCSYPANVVVVQAFHGGLLGDASVLQMASDFLGGQNRIPSSPGLRTEAELIAAASTAWRMPSLHTTCPPRLPGWYAHGHDAKAAVVAPPVGGCTLRVLQTKRPPRTRRPLFHVRPGITQCLLSRQRGHDGQSVRNQRPGTGYPDR
jgi:hypothetical protein